MDYPSFVGGDYQSQAWSADAERLINWYVEKLESPGATSRSALYPTPGVAAISTAVSGPGRAHFAMAGREFAVIGTTFFEIAVFGVQTSRGTVAIGTHPATISSNGDGGGQLFITSGDNGYIYDTTTHAFTQVAALNGKATMGDHLDGFFLALDAATSTFYISNLLDGLTWNTGTDFAQRSKAPDPWVALVVNGPYIALLGEQTSEFWYNTGASFPFAPHPSGLIPYGCAAAFSAKVANGSLIWLGASKIGDAYVLQTSGFSPEVVSNYPMQAFLNGYTTLSDAVADVYNDLGHTFYILNLPTMDVTWAWDQMTGLWAQRGAWISENSAYSAWRPRFHAVAFGENRMLDSSTGAVYTMASYLPNDVDDRPIRRLRRAPCLMDENQRIFFPGFEVDLQPGVGTLEGQVAEGDPRPPYVALVASGQGNNPQVMMRLSNDGGQTWTSERWKSAGKIGEYGKPVRWDRCGSGRRRVFEIVVSDPVPWRVTAAYLTPDPYPLRQQQRGAA